MYTLVRNSALLTDVEKIIIKHFLDNEQHDGNSCIFLNETGLYELPSHELVNGVFHLIDLGIVQRRKDDSITYDWDLNSKKRLKDYLESERR